MRNTKSYTMDDIAEELGISKSTVSRALAGSGRISEETRQKVENCAKQHGYKPNPVAKALAGQKTLNIACVMPLEATSLQMSFFHECLSGIVKSCSEEGYTVLVCMTGDEENSSLENIITYRKVDAVILTQLKKNDKNVELLKNNSVPFVVIGSGAGEKIVQVDSKMRENCAEFTKKCAETLGERKNVLFVCGSLDVEANNNRLSGFFDGIEELNDDTVKQAVCTDFNDLEDELTLSDWDLILCSDDIVCTKVLNLLEEKKILIGKQVKVASFHDSVLLELRKPSISALRVDGFKLGFQSAAAAIKLLSDSEYEMMNYVDCSFEMRASTR